jgi:predicted O-methyltransferase YrrM
MIKKAARWIVSQLRPDSTRRKYVEHELLNDPTIRFAPPGHFYSPLPNVREIEEEADRFFNPALAEDGVRLDLQEQQRLLATLAEFSSQFDWPEDPVPGRRFFINNDYFGPGDALILYSMIRHFRPRRIIEVGSGFSSALMLDTNDRLGDPKMELCFIEPYPDRLESLLTKEDKKSVKLLAMPVQRVPLELFDALEANDILFIDSSHVAKIGSDVNHLFFSILPRLADGVLIHIHDIFYPFEYPREWLREGRSWNELYFLRAFLQYNSAFEVLLFNGYLWHHSASFIEARLPLMAINPGGSIWLRKRSRNTGSDRAVKAGN